MRGSVAENRGNVGSYKGDTGTKGGSGYSLKPTNQGERGVPGARRAATQNTELRLGKLQVVVWLGLALGSVVGAYFVGFFSGRYVGFESARESSAGEVAKLPVPETFQGGYAQNVGNVYDKLKAPAVLRVPENNEGQQRPQNNQLDIRNESPKLVDEQEIRRGENGPETEQDLDSADNGQIEAQQGEGNLEDLVADVQNGPQLIIGGDEGLAAAKVPESVRMLGGAEVAKDAGQRKVEPSAKPEKSASALLEERIANARGDSAKTPQSAAPSAKAESKDSGPLVRKVVPSGFFAQVAAPKKLSEAESIAGRLKRSGFPVVVESASVAGQSFYRVLVGPEQNKVQADRLVSQLKSESYLSGDPFIRKVK